jgi:hypothetical protein
MTEAHCEIKQEQDRRKNRKSVRDSVVESHFIINTKGVAIRV